jgi:hypothetical protein
MGSVFTLGTLFALIFGMVAAWLFMQVRARSGGTGPAQG